jgi:hypothetical protein
VEHVSRHEGEARRLGRLRGGELRIQGHAVCPRHPHVAEDRVVRRGLDQLHRRLGVASKIGGNPEWSQAVRQDGGYLHLVVDDQHPPPP